MEPCELLRAGVFSASRTTDPQLLLHPQGSLVNPHKTPKPAGLPERGAHRGDPRGAVRKPQPLPVSRTDVTATHGPGPLSPCRRKLSHKETCLHLCPRSPSPACTVTVPSLSLRMGVQLNASEVDSCYSCGGDTGTRPARRAHPAPRAPPFSASSGRHQMVQGCHPAPSRGL